MSNKSEILILTICSNSKTRESESSAYQAVETFGASIPKNAPLLFDGRRYVCGLITNKNELSRDGKLLHDFPFNRNLDKDGPDIRPGGTPRHGLYLPAAKRYRGRFYRELGEEAYSLLTQTPHHVLIVSGLYGLLTPSEPIQCYSCNVTDHPAIAKCWTENDRLTGLITAYIKRFGIAKVFELMAEDSYRRLISWTEVRQAVNGHVLHCFSPQYAGAALLPSLGILTRQLLTQSEDDLFKISSGDFVEIRDDKILFQPSRIPESPDAAREIETQPARVIQKQIERLNINDKIGRMRRNINRILAKAVGPSDPLHGFSGQVHKLKQRVPSAYKAAKLMQEFEHIRNTVEYTDHRVTEIEWTDICRSYGEIMTWGRAYGCVDDALLEKVDI